MGIWGDDRGDSQLHISTALPGQSEEETVSFDLVGSKLLDVKSCVSGLLSKHNSRGDASLKYAVLTPLIPVAG